MASTSGELLSALRTAFPQLFTRREEDGEVIERLDLEKVRLLAGDGNYADRYGLRWEEKPERFDTESAGKLPSLKHVAAKSLRADAAKPTHVLIEGDNYHALKVLAYTHERSVDVIYIDPPLQHWQQGLQVQRPVCRQGGRVSALEVAELYGEALEGALMRPGRLSAFS